MFKPISTVTVLAALLCASAGSAQAADPVRGKRLFMQCSYCHGAQGQGGAAGPPLKSIIGKKAAQAPAFTYSPAMKASGLTWSEANLAAFLTSPQAKMKGTQMMFVGFEKPTDTDDIIAYLKTIK